MKGLCGVENMKKNNIKPNKEKLSIDKERGYTLATIEQKFNNPCKTIRI